MYFLSSVKNSLKKGQKFVTINDNQCPLSYHGNSQGGKPSLANTSHCHRKKRKTSRVMRMDGLRFEAEERSRLQRLPWHEQIDTIAPPPKCRVLGQVWSASDWGLTWICHMSQVLHLLVTCSLLDPPVLLQVRTPCLLQWLPQNCPCNSHLILAGDTHTTLC